MATVRGFIGNIRGFYQKIQVDSALAEIASCWKFIQVYFWQACQLLEIFVFHINTNKYFNIQTHISHVQSHCTPLLNSLAKGRMTSFWPISAQLHVAGLYSNIKAYFHCTRLPNTAASLESVETLKLTLV